jgi:hypothetical protein
MTDRKSQVFQDSLKRWLYVGKIYEYACQDIQKSELIKELARQAKENGKKGWLDLRTVAADNIRLVQGSLIKMRQSEAMKADTLRVILGYLDSDVVHETALILDEVSKLHTEQELLVLKEVVAEAVAKIVETRGLKPGTEVVITKQ